MMLSESHSLGTFVYLSLKWVSYYLLCCLARLPETHLGSPESVWKNFSNNRVHLCLSPSVPEGGWVTFPSGLCHNRGLGGGSRWWGAGLLLSQRGFTSGATAVQAGQMPAQICRGLVLSSVFQQQL